MFARNLLEFPAAPPEGFPPLEDEPVFDPARHLALEKPETIVGLEDLGYGEELIDRCPTRLAMSSSFRLLTAEGVACLAEVAHRLERHARTIERIPRMVRGGVYHSRFLRALCLSADVTAFLSEIYGAPVAPHTIPHQLGHLNYSPHTIGENVDKWHADTLRLDYVLFVTDPNAIVGGEFQTFRGTTHEAAELKRLGMSLPEDRVESWKVPGAGYALLLQGNLVVHRARRLDAPGERITMVNGYVPCNLDVPDFTRFDQLCLADPPLVAMAEYQRHAAWIARERLQHLIERPLGTSDRDTRARELEDAATILQNAASQIRAAGQAAMEHFGDD